MKAFNKDPNKKHRFIVMYGTIDDAYKSLLICFASTAADADKGILAAMYFDKVTNNAPRILGDGSCKYMRKCIKEKVPMDEMNQGLMSFKPTY